MQKVLYALNTAFVILLLLAYISPYVNPVNTSLFSLFGLFYIIILYFNIAFIILWLMVKPKYSLISALAIFIGWGSLSNNIGFQKGDNSKDGLNIINYNIGKTRYEVTKENASELISKFQDIISVNQPDVVCLQERVKWHKSYYDKIFSSYKLYAEDDLGTAIYSKLPVVNHGNLAFGTNAHNATWIDLEYEKDTVRVYSIHLSSNHVTKVTGEILDKPDLRKKKIWDDFKFILGRYNKHAKIRVGQLKRIIEHSEKSQYPVILTGDFNDIPQSYIYKMISRKYNDAFKLCGSGIQKTFISSIPGLRIDYTFVDKKLKVLNQQIIKSKLSDHYPLMTSIDRIK